MRNNLSKYEPLTYPPTQILWRWHKCHFSNYIKYSLHKFWLIDENNQLNWLSGATLRLKKETAELRRVVHVIRLYRNDHDEDQVCPHFQEISFTLTKIKWCKVVVTVMQTLQMRSLLNILLVMCSAQILLLVLQIASHLQDTILQ